MHSHWCKECDKEFECKLGSDCLLGPHEDWYCFECLDRMDEENEKQEKV